MIKFFWRIRNFASFFFSRKTLGARALVIQGDQILLVKHTYVPGWCTVGGGVDQGETGMQALIRELREEVGIEVRATPSLFGFYHKPHMKHDDYIVLYVCKTLSQKKVYSPEILESRWFPLNDLPHDTTPATRRRIEEFLGQRPLSETW